jgi:hypothetical protein
MKMIQSKLQSRMITLRSSLFDSVNMHFQLLPLSARSIRTMQSVPGQCAIDKLSYYPFVGLNCVISAANPARTQLVDCHDDMHNILALPPPVRHHHIIWRAERES